VVSFIEGVPSNHYNINPEKLKKHLKRKCERKRKISSTMMLKKLKKTQNHTKRFSFNILKKRNE